MHGGRAPTAFLLRPAQSCRPGSADARLEKADFSPIFPRLGRVDLEKPIRGEVIAVGNGKFLQNGDVHPVDVKPGDHVLFGKYSGTEVNVDGEDLLVMREGDVMGVFEM